MRKIILFVVLSLSIPLFSQEIVPFGKISFGYFLSNRDKYYENYDSFDYDYPDYCSSLNLNLGAHIGKYISIEGTCITYMNVDFIDSFGFSPFQSEYYIGAYVSKDNITIGYEHSCYHPTLSSYNNNVFKHYGGYDLLYVSWEF